MSDGLPRLDDLRQSERLLIFVILGGIAALGQAPIGWWPVTLLALTAVLFLHDQHGHWRRAALHGWVFGIGYFAFSLRWIVEPFLVDIARHGWMAPFALVLMAAGAGIFWALAFGAAQRFAPRSVLMLALALVAVEVLRSQVFTGFPWALLGHVLIGTPFDQLAAYGGPHLLSVVAVFLSWAVLQLLRNRLAVGAGALAGAILVALVLWFGAGPMSQEGGPVVRLVQPNAPQEEKWDPTRSQIFLDRLLDYSARGPVPDLIVWPETSVPYLLNHIEDDLTFLSDAARGAPLVFGILRRDTEGGFFNSAVLLDASGAVAQTYDKRHLVPFGEYLPFGQVLSQFGLSALADAFGASFSIGTQEPALSIAGIGAAVPLICYEGIFAEEILRPDSDPRLLLLITNDAWFGRAAGPFQHLAQARLRAIEQGLPMVRVANTGISAVIDARGNILEQLPLGVDGALDVALPKALPTTLYARFGDWPVVFMLLGAAIALVVRRPQR